MAGKKRKPGKYEADLVKTYHQVSGKPKKARKKGFSTVLIILVLVVFLAALGAGAYLYFFSGVTPGLILNNVSVLDISIGGMSKEDATAYLQQAFQEDYCSNNMKITVFDQDIELDAATAGLSLDVAAVVEDAYKLGRDGTQAQRKKEQMQAMAGRLELDPEKYLKINEEAVKQQIQDLCSSYATEVTDHSWELMGEIPDLTTEEMPETPLVLTIHAGTPGYDIDQEALLEDVLDAYYRKHFQVEYEPKILEPAVVDLDAVYAEICLEPVEAQMDKETFEVSSHAYGVNFDLDAAKKLQESLNYGESADVQISYVAPTSTKVSLESLLFRDVLGSCTARASSQPYGRDINLKLSCEKINGIVLMPGEVFSYNPALGKRTPENGWKQADTYVGGETVQSYGGGICQTSSCLYLSALRADLEIVERTNHGYISSYMPYGMDATVSWGGPEFKFKNSTEYPLRIEASASGGSVTINLIGTDTKDYYVKMIYEVVSTDPFETVYEEMPADNEKGFKDGDVIVSAYTGYVIRTYRCKYDKQTDELISKDLEVKSTYNRRDKVVCKIIPEEVPTDPTDPSVTPTDPSVTPTDPSEESTEPTTSGPITEDGA